MAARFLMVNSSNSKRYDAEGRSDIFRANSEQDIIRKFRMSKSDIGQVCDMAQEKLTPFVIKMLIYICKKRFFCV